VIASAGKVLKMIEWLGLNDKKAAVGLFGTLTCLFLLLGLLPMWLHRQSMIDYAGTVKKTVPGYVSLVTISPVSQGGGSLFNAVAVTFAGYQHYYALPPQSRWDPIYGQHVTVTYQIGHSGDVQVDDVQPISPPVAPGPR
jgi:hypothetical protein